ncbi:MAG: hypothetical protein KBC57_12965 [Neisseriaceae bacterium]|nr:hypothetical protein [Neisseriaceae bacterium]MBP6863250.1 hypothetical protein [Neisseriaceae bacterium]
MLASLPPQRPRLWTLASTSWLLSLSLIFTSPTALANSTARAKLATLLVPPAYSLKSERQVPYNNGQAQLSRYERTDGRNNGLNGEHISFLIDAQGQLKGYIKKEQNQAQGTLPSQAEARSIAEAFVRQQGPTLLNGFKHDGVSRQTETLRQGSQSVQIPYLRVKMRSSDGLWFWVFVGTDKQVMAFERDIGWDYLRFRRSTEQWLLDDQRPLNG